MNKTNSFLLILAVVLISVVPTMSQVTEPEFIGESYLLKADGAYIHLDKEIGDFTSGMSWSSNSWNALSLEVTGAAAKTRFSLGEPLQLVLRAVDNNSDPLTIITIFKFSAKKKKRTVMLGKDNSGTFLKSRTNSKDMVRFSGKKYGTSSYLIALQDLEAGEYGVVVSNPNTRDEKRVVVSCFGIDSSKMNSN
jgi:hypothetical protein